ncbi:hypothetical protein A0H81_00198 [Grifola frondosa]|uniref:Uncharacterized protein n=1 Tax=Grifola frondosa TaxID=5627 RepID=A0A1C7MR55_GRIFR|nr:hypothetical protein A0H81_00198 [Grifola frondosa]
MAGIHPKLRVILELPPLPPPSPNRLVIPIPPDKPVRDLLAEVVRRCKLDEAQHRALKLYNTSDALLFPEDEVGDVILSGEIVVARFDAPPQEPIAPPVRPTEHSDYKEKGLNEKRIKIALITLNLLGTEAKVKHPK